MLVPNHADPVAVDSVSLSHPLADSTQHVQDKVVYLPENVPAQVVYVPQPSPHKDSRVTNMMQGHEFQSGRSISEGVVQFQNNVSERIVYVPANTEGESKNLNIMSDNTSSGDIVYVQRNKPDDNVNSQNTTTETVTYVTNPKQERVVYVPYPTPTGERNMLDSTSKVPVNDGNRTPVRVVYVPHNVSGGNENCISRVAIHAPNNKQGENLCLPQNMPMRTPSPDRTQDRALEIVQQVMKMATELSKEDDDENKNPENIVYMTQPPAMYSPYMVGNGSGFIPQMQLPVGYMPQMPQSMGCMPQMQTPMGYMPQMQHMAYGPEMQLQTPYMSQMIQQQLPYMRMMNPARLSPSPHQIQNEFFQNSSPSLGAEQSFTPEAVSQLPDVGVPDSGDGLPDIIDTDIISDDCGSWFDCCCCLFSGSNE